MKMHTTWTCGRWIASQTAAIVASLSIGVMACGTPPEEEPAEAVASTGLTAGQPFSVMEQHYREYMASHPEEARWHRTRYPNSRLARELPPVAKDVSGNTGAIERTSQALITSGGQVIDSLEEYAARCNIATGITVPAFRCNDGIEVPNQEKDSSGRCNKPNILENACDPGSKFQVLARTADAVAVAHCRPQGRLNSDPLNPGNTYVDIAVIQYNKKNGALCFYQNALTAMTGDMPAPSGGVGKWRSPTVNVNSCTGCHDNGGFLRSPYLAQLTPAYASAQGKPNHYFPNADAASGGFGNEVSKPVRHVGLEYKSKKSWSVRLLPSSDPGNTCVGCHVLAVNNTGSGGTAGKFAVQATENPYNDSKRILSSASPMWMLKDSTTFSSGNLAIATKFQKCATDFRNNGFLTSPAGCEIAPFAGPWTGLDAAQIVSILR